MSNKYVEVAPALPLKASGTQVYTYQIPEKTKETLKKFSAVTVPFGKRYVAGVVTKIHATPVPYPTKPIANITATTLTGKQVLFATWISRTMQGGLGYTLRLFQPPGKTFNNNASFSAVPKTRVKSNVIKALSKSSAALIDYNLQDREAVISGLIGHMAKLGKQVLTIVPEKALLEGPGVSYSADMKRQEATTIWQEVKKGSITAVRGTQKSLYLPFKQLGLIIVEEEQYSTHKLWDQYPKFHNKDAARALAQIHGCPVLYTAAYPSLDIYYGIKTEQLVCIKNEPIKIHTSVVTLSFDDKMKKYIIPHTLVLKIKKWASEKEKVLIYYDRTNNARLQYVLKANLSDASYKNCTISTSKIFAKGLKKKFDRVVWLYPERSLSFPDFRSLEKSLITLTRLHQISSSMRRNIYIVTKEEATINEILKSTADIYDRELRTRKPLRLPPYQAQVRLRISSTNPKRAEKKSQDVLKQIEKRLSTASKEESSEIIIRGPYTGNNKKQWYILLRGPLETLTKLYGGLGVDYADLSPATII